VTRKPSAELRAALLSLDELEGVELRLPPAWVDERGQWMLELELEAPVPSAHVPQRTDWVVLVDETYPLGRIEFVPAATERVLQATFPHQRANTRDPKLPFRDGKLCLDRPGHLVDPFASGREPRRAGTRLRWHVQRALAWLAAAARDQLLQPGDPFELPALPHELHDAVAFCEGHDTYASWSSSKTPSGFAILQRLGPKLLVTRRFTTWNGAPVAETRWGTAVSEARQEDRCAWIRLERPPTLAPWKWPSTWDELRTAAGVALDVELEKVVRRFRDGKPHLLLIGFPVPSVTGGPATEIYWSGAYVGPFTPLKPGHSAAAVWERDRRQMFGSQRIAWCSSENWHPTRLGARGQLAPSLRSERVALIGVGALGSMLAELLVRGGTYDLTLVDGERVEAGNLVRHVLTQTALGEFKAKALAAHLNAVSPHARVVAVPRELPLAAAEVKELLEPFDLVIDCTSSDDVLIALGRVMFGGPKSFASASVGWACRRLFCFLARATSFPSEEYWRQVGPWLTAEREAEIPAEERWAGAGCWHPVFPAQAVDLSLMAAAATKEIEHAATSPYDGVLHVFERVATADGFLGLRRAELKDL
jgi:hypothetical protein